MMLFCLVVVSSSDTIAVVIVVLILETAFSHYVAYLPVQEVA